MCQQKPHPRHYTNYSSATSINRCMQGTKKSLQNKLCLFRLCIQVSGQDKKSLNPTESVCTNTKTVTSQIRKSHPRILILFVCCMPE